MHSRSPVTTSTRPKGTTKSRTKTRASALLARYDEKRHFDQTPEPSGKENFRTSKLIPALPAGSYRFVVQKHHASRLHYDFRLEADQVLKSWAVPKGPSLDPADKRLAMQVEDHPLSYFDFEGVIPSGNYGAGEVIVWDVGAYTLAPGEGDDPGKAIEAGKIKFVLAGKKLRGMFTLVKMHGRSGDHATGGKPWLLIKDKDDYVRHEDVTADGTSAVTGKTLDDVAHDPKAPHWQSNRPARSETAAKAPTPKKAAKAKSVKRTKADPFPHVKTPMLATLADAPFDDDAWLFEVKWDGFRALATIDPDGTVDLRSRNGLDLGKRFPQLRTMASGFVPGPGSDPDGKGGHPLLVDGEIVVFDEAGRSSFQALQNAESGQRAAATFVAFDLLYADGRDLRGLPLDARKEALAAHIVDGQQQVLLSKHVVGAGNQMFALAEKNRLEGIIAKRRDSLYREARTKDWLKIKVKNEQEVIIVGYTSPRGTRSDLGALILGVYEEVDGKRALVPAGHVGTGFDRKMLATLRKKLDPLKVARSPLSRSIKANGEVHWVKPVLVCQVRFAEWTEDGILRQASFLGMRDDKAAREVVRELPKVHPAEEAAPASGAKTAPKATKAATKTGTSGLDALDSDARSASVTVGDRTLAVSNLGKVLYPGPADGITKGRILAFYRDISPYLLPHLARRPLTLERYPDGIEASSFFEKNVPRGAPPWLTTQRVAHGMYSSRDKPKRPHIDFVVCDDLASLIWLVNLGSFVMHIWTSRVETLDQPDWVLFDLDPGEGCTVKTMALVALAVRDALEAIGLPSLVKTTGGHGLHVIVPLAPGYDYDEAKAFAELVARRVESQVPELVTLERTIARRPAGRIYFDYVQVGRGKTMVPPYVLRAKPGAPVSMPLEWSEVEAMKRSRSDDTTTEMRKFTLKNALARLEKKGDLWGAVTGPLEKRGVKLEPALKKAAKAWT